MAFGTLSALQDQIRLLQQRGGPRCIETLDHTLTALIQTRLGHHNTTGKQAQEPRVARYPEADACRFCVRKGLRVETTPSNVDNNRKRSWPEHAG